MDKRKKVTKTPFFITNTQGQPTSIEPKVIEIGDQIPRKPPIQCWGCKGDHMFKDCPHRGDKVVDDYSFVRHPPEHVFL